MQIFAQTEESSVADLDQRLFNFENSMSIFITKVLSALKYSP